MTRGRGRKAGAASRLRWMVLVASVVLVAACTPPPPPTPTPTTFPPATTTIPPATTTTSTTTTTAPAPQGGTSFVYVAEANLGAIKKIDTVTLATVETIDLGGPIGGGLALSGSRLLYTAGSSTRLSIGSYDLATGVNDRAYIESTYYRPWLVTSPALPGRLFVAERGLSPGIITQWDVSTASPTLVNRTPHSEVGSNIRDIAVSKDGTRIWVAAGAPYEITEVRTSDLLASGKVFPTGAYPIAVTSTTVGGVETLVGGRAGTPGVFAFDPANPAAATPYPTIDVLQRGLGASVDGSKLFAAVESNPLTLVTIDRSAGSISTAPLDSTLTAQQLTMGELVVDPGTGRVFVSVTDAIAVYNPDGTFGTMLVEPGPRGMVMSATGPTSTPPRLGPAVPVGRPPVISSFTASRTSGPAPLTTAFSWNVSDPDGQPLTCRLDFDVDGTWDLTVNACTSQSMRSATFGTPGSHPVRLQVTDTSQSSAIATVTLAVGSATADPFDITLRFSGNPTTAQRAAFSNAAARWSQVIRGGLADVAVNLPANDCGTGAPALSTTIDDLVIDVDVSPIDGPSGILGEAGPCLVRTAGELPAYGVMKLDAADLVQMEATGLLGPVILHEMGHVLGLGTLWYPPHLSGAGTSGVNFTGPVALGAWRTLSAAAGGVPVENSGGAGTADAHWRESVFGSELMTGWVNAGSNPLSRVTIGALADLGYTVDLGAADSFGLSGLRASEAATSAHVHTRPVRPVGAV